MPVVNYVWDTVEDNIVEEFDDADNTIADYTTEPDLYGNITSQYRNGASGFFHFDAVGSTHAVSNVNQQVTDARAYSAFGETTDDNGVTVFSYEYVGKQGYYSGLAIRSHVIRRRWYEPWLGRWLSTDTAPRSVKNINAYSYVDNRPLYAVDPSGEQATCPPGAKSRQVAKGGTGQARCEYRAAVPNPSWKPTPNGCSAPLVGGSFGSWDFTPACDKHDLCYGTCGASKRKCDKLFYKLMTAICDALTGNAKSRCHLTATMFVNAVDNFGTGWYEAAQDKACSWIKCSPSSGNLCGDEGPSCIVITFGR